jgi:hypothetical protein
MAQRALAFDATLPCLNEDLYDRDLDKKKALTV